MLCIEAITLRLPFHNLSDIFLPSISILLVFSISIKFVLVSDLGSASPFFRDELLAPVLLFVSVDRGERELSGKRIVT